MHEFSFNFMIDLKFIFYFLLYFHPYEIKHKFFIYSPTNKSQKEGKEQKEHNRIRETWQREL